jgi:site-specific DNA-methyltransferase (adenine-specific)
MLNKIIHGDCLVESEQIESGSVDLILTDLPYGTMNGYNGIDWDFAIDPDKVYEIANRILRKNGKMVLFSQEPYTSRLITKAIPDVPFSYRMVWEKDSFANALGCNKAPVSYYEDILVFSKTHDTDGVHPLRAYSRKVFEFMGVAKADIKRSLGHQRWVHFFQFDEKRNIQFNLCTEQTYEELIAVFNIDRMDGFIPYEELVEIDRHFSSVFNLWEGGKYKSNILRYKKDYDGFHPTQKPVLLLEDLIKTYSNEGDLVVDLTMGSGSTAIACINTGRFFIGIEKEKKYFDIANERIANHTIQQRLKFA